MTTINNNCENTMQSIDWEGRGDISQEVHRYVGSSLEYWQAELANEPDNEKYQGIVAAFNCVLNFIEN
jgi:hypothetical protein